MATKLKKKKLVINYSHYEIADNAFDRSPLKNQYLIHFQLLTKNKYCRSNDILMANNNSE